MSDKKNNALELADVIEGLRNELEKAKQQGEGKSTRFGVNHIEVELNVSVMKQIKVTAGAKAEMDSGESILKFIVGKFKGELKIEGEGTYQKVSTQKITLNLSSENVDIETGAKENTRLSGVRDS